MDTCDSNTLLKSRKIKITAQRLEILNLIIQNNHPFTANELHYKIKTESGIDLATVYRFINLLVKSRIIREVANSGGFQYYELACEHHPLHPHFICENCKNISCLKNFNPLDAVNLGAYTGSNSVRSISLNFTGVCGKCQNIISKNGDKS